MKKLKGRIIAILLALVLCVALMPPRASALGMQTPQPADIQRNTTVVGFAGHQWYVIGFNDDGVYSTLNEKAVTLLLKDSGTPDTAIAFRNGGDDPTGHPSWVLYNGTYYEPTFTQPSDYNDSTLQKRTALFANSITGKEQDLFTLRTLTASDGINGIAVEDQKMWPLSFQEWNTIADNTVCGYFKDYWLRTDGAEDYQAWYGENDGNNLHTESVTFNTPALRPAFKLDLSGALFASASPEPYAPPGSPAERGKSEATVGGGLIGATPLNGAMKFTVKHASQTLTVTTNDEQMNQTGTTLTFPYSNATTGTNQYVSCVLVNSSNEVKYYGKLADSSSDSSGNISIPLAGVADGAYGLLIFSEEANDDNFTDFCSDPAFMYLIVQNGIGRLMGLDTWIYDGSAVRTSASSADIRFSSLMDGLYFWQLDGTPPANAGELLGGGASIETLSAGLNTKSISGLSEGGHILYIVGMDAYENYSNILRIVIPAYVPPTTRVPRTGDNGIIPGWLMLSASVSGILILTAWRKYRKSKGER
jgi:hypothetical protein